MSDNNFEYPEALDPDLVGTYPAVVSSGAGHFFDDVLEYRVWCYIEDGAENEAGDDDYFYAFETFEEAHEFYEQTKGAQLPFALIRQHEWIDEYEPGKFRAESGERIAEWPAELLEGKERQDDSIKNFFKNKDKRERMKKYGKYFILIGIVSLALGVGVGLTIKKLVGTPETKPDSVEQYTPAKINTPPNRKQIETN